MAAISGRGPNASATRSRLRLVVIQALVFSLFATLFVRLYYLQVVTGEEYHAQAASQSVREIVVQPQRGLIVDDMGRPLVANRSSWVVSVDRTMLGKMAPGQRNRVIARLATVVDQRPARIRQRLVTCGDPGSLVGSCWNGSPYQPVPVATDVRQGMALRVLEQPEDFPSVLAAQQSVRAYPEPYGVNLAHALGYLSPITEAEYDRANDAGDASLNGASSVGRAGVEKQYDRWLRGMPGYKRVAVDSMGRVLGDDSEVESKPGATLVTSIDAKVQGVVERQLASTIKTARATFDSVSGKNYVADSGAAVVMEARTGRIVALASQPTYDPGVWVGGITNRQLARLYSEKAGTPLLGRATQGQFAPGSTWKPFMTAGALTNGFTPDTRLNCSSSFRVGNRVLQELRVRRLRVHLVRQGPRGLLQHLLLPDRLRVLAPVRHRHRRRARPGPAGRGGQEVRLRQRDRHRPARGGVRPDRRPVLEAGLLQVAEALLLRHRRGRSRRRTGHQRLRLPVHPGVLRRGLRLPGRRRGELRDRPGRHHRHAAPARPRATPPCRTAARSSRPGSARRSSAPTAT